MFVEKMKFGSKQKCLENNIFRNFRNLQLRSSADINIFLRRSLGIFMLLRLRIYLKQAYKRLENTLNIRCI